MWIYAFLVVVVMMWLLVRMVRTQATGGERLSGAAFKAAFEAHPGAVIIDVRTPGEFASGHMNGARNIDVQGKDFMNTIVKLDPAKSYFVYCRSGMRSAQAVSLMKQKGFTNIYELAGGASASPQLMTVR